MALTIIYACGLRVSEGVRLTTSDIDGKINLLRVRDGKGGKDRNVPLHKHAQELLRVYYRKYGEGSVFLYPHFSQPWEGIYAFIPASFLAEAEYLASIFANLRAQIERDESQNAG